jgi:hypothetical protein
VVVFYYYLKTLGEEVHHLGSDSNVLLVGGGTLPAKFACGSIIVQE